MADKLILRQTRNTQLNEKVSTTQYDVLYPETTAAQVITNDNRMFVTKQQIEEWTAGKGSLHFRGSWKVGIQYVKGDIVEYKGYYFIVGLNHTSEDGKKPDPNLAITTFTDLGLIYWYNLEYISNISEKTKELKTISTGHFGKFFLTFVNSNNSDSENESFEKVYTNVSITYEPGTETLTVPNIKGTITEALHAKEADHAKNADGSKHAAEADKADTAVNYYNTKAVSKKTNIQETIEGINKRLEDITSGSGGAVLSNKLFIQKNGNPINPDGFDGSVEQTVNLTIVPKDVTGLLNSLNKIDNKWLPDSILGNLKYIGTVNEEGIISSNDADYNGKNISTISVSANVGCYFLASFKNTKNPANLVGIDDVRHGDWIVSNGSAGWVKVDNTDAVTMVNSQVGAIETYKKDWKASATYYPGDIVKYQNALYIVNKKHTTVGNWEQTAVNYDIFGRVYTASDGIKLEGNTFKHSTSVTSEASDDLQLLYGDVFSVPTVTLDSWGHVTKIKTTNFTLPALIPDTWRPIVIGGKEVLNKDNTSGKLIFNNTDKIKVEFNNSMVEILHEKAFVDGGSFEGTINTQSPGLQEKRLLMGNGFTIPEFDYDVYGHITGIRSGTYRLPEGIIEHNHFLVKTENGTSIVQAYPKVTANENWVKSVENEGKFYLGDFAPYQRLQMNYNGIFAARELMQNNNGVLKKVLDAGTGIISGKKLNGRDDIVSEYDASKNAITLGDSGVIQGTYSAIAVNSKGIVTYGGAILEFGHVTSDPSTNEPSASLAVGGLFFRHMPVTA